MPAEAGIQYAGTPELFKTDAGYVIIRLRG
jgi:hypothetical protein